jgi:uncharacterized membrane protein
MDNKMIVLEPASNLRARGRATLTGYWQNAIIAMLIYMLFMDLAGSLIDSMMGDSYMLSSLFKLAVSGPFGVGVATYFLQLFRHQEAQISHVFSGFENFGKTFVLGLLIGIFTFLWTLLLIVPGVIAYFRYSQAYFIMCDHPEYSAMECINESKRMMDGNKGKLFVTTLSFIGWAILALLPSMFYAGWVSIDSISQYTAVSSTFVPSVVYSAFDYIAMFVLALAYTAVLAYYKATCVSFYELLKGNISGQVFIPEKYESN